MDDRSRRLIASLRAELVAQLQHHRGRNKPDDSDYIRGMRDGLGGAIEVVEQHLDRALTQKGVTGRTLGRRERERIWIPIVRVQP